MVFEKISVPSDRNTRSVSVAPLNSSVMNPCGTNFFLSVSFFMAAFGPSRTMQPGALSFFSRRRHVLPPPAGWCEIGRSAPHLVFRSLRNAAVSQATPEKVPRPDARRRRCNRARVPSTRP